MFVQRLNKSLSVHCPYCNSIEIIKNGLVKEVQRFRCKSCKKNFNSFTGSSLYRVKKKEIFYQYLNHFGDESTIRDCASTYNVSIATSFAWRHRILGAVRSESNQTPLHSGVAIKISDVKFSQKGAKGNKKNKTKKADKIKVKLMIMYSETQAPRLFSLCDTFANVNTITRFLRKNIDQKTIINFEPNRGICIASRKIKTRSIKTRRITKSNIYIKTKLDDIVNNYNLWILRFRGVSTKYLQNYLSWFSFLKQNNNHHKYHNLVIFNPFNNKTYRLFHNQRNIIHKLEQIKNITMAA